MVDKKPPLFALVDCNNFFVSCERVRSPELEGRPVVVLSCNDGCIISRSNEAKTLGIPMGAPLFKVREKLARADGVIRSSDFHFYSEISDHIQQCLDELGLPTENYSVDEAFLELSELNGERMWTDFGHYIRRVILEETRIPVTVGIAPTKTLAKVATEHAKTSRKARSVLALTDPRWIQVALERLPLEDIWGVGRRLSARLYAEGLHNGWDLASLPILKGDPWILQHFGIVLMRTIYELRGISCIPIQQSTAPAKTIICSRSFGQMQTTQRALEEAVATFTSRAGVRLREKGLQASHLSVTLKTNRHRTQDPQYHASEGLYLPYPSDATPELIYYARQLVTQLFRPGYRYKKALVMLSELTLGDQQQLNLFDARPHDKLAQLMQTVDAVNQRFGGKTLKYAAEGLSADWKPQSAYSDSTTAGEGVIAFKSRLF